MVANGTIYFGGHQATRAVQNVAVAPGCTFAHVWRVTFELCESELSLVTLW